MLILLAMILMTFAVLHFGSSERVRLAASGAANGGQVLNQQRSPRLYSVFYKGGVFSPTNLRIQRGDTVKFINESKDLLWLISDPHPEHDNAVDFNSRSEILPSGLFSYTFKTAGLFPYHNEKNVNEYGLVMVR